MACLARVAWLHSLVGSGYQISANVSTSNSRQGPRTCISFVAVRGDVCGSDAAVVHLLNYVASACNVCNVWDRGHRHSDGKSVAKFYLSYGVPLGEAARHETDAPGVGDMDAETDSQQAMVAELTAAEEEAMLFLAESAVADQAVADGSSCGISEQEWSSYVSEASWPSHMLEDCEEFEAEGGSDGRSWCSSMLSWRVHAFANPRWPEWTVDEFYVVAARIRALRPYTPCPYPVERMRMITNAPWSSTRGMSSRQVGNLNVTGFSFLAP